jgi:hypothetical protein
VHEARASRMRVHWVKVKGHSAHEGNDAADLCATWAINGGWSNIQPIMTVMQAIKDDDWAQLLHVEAAYDQDYLDTGFVNNARPNGVPKPPPTLHYPGDPWWLRWTAEQTGRDGTHRWKRSYRQPRRRALHNGRG